MTKNISQKERWFAAIGVLTFFIVGVCFISVRKSIASESLSGCNALVDQAAQYYAIYKEPTGQREMILKECQKHLHKTCSGNQECGSFPCINNTCLVKPCNSDSDCPGLCGLHVTPVPRFCTTIDVK